MASTSRVSRVGVAGALPPRALVLPSFRGGSARPRRTRGQALGVVARRDLRLLRDVAMRARREAEAARARNEPSGDTGAHDTELFATHRGKTLHRPSRILEAATYVRTHGAEASAEDAASRGITAGCLSSVALSLLGDLEDVLLTSKLHVSFLAAIRSRITASDSTSSASSSSASPPTALAATRHLVEVLAAMRSDAAAAKAAADGEENAADARPLPSTYDTVLRTLVPKLFRRKGEPKPDPANTVLSPAAGAANAAAPGGRATPWPYSNSSCASAPTSSSRGPPRRWWRTSRRRNPTHLANTATAEALGSNPLGAAFRATVRAVDLARTATPTAPGSIATVWNTARAPPGPSAASRDGVFESSPQEHSARKRRSAASSAQERMEAEPTTSLEEAVTRARDAEDRNSD